ncbi:hypothetical protein JHN59_37080 [Streptomyces sp. MBT49]|uniref:hypothetical protein n=1 Tax=unclassified Streptomyces TaxID=2593676 RepID=UPI00190BC78A|nr:MULTISPECIES: hypothetical protein [unclassified Streptomyces]MBK3630315.1 hypothetical protein [Streptomyces sp. MBT49]MBK3634702.1 hypothetical protein [Streptomyces sp. MBT97]
MNDVHLAPAGASRLRHTDGVVDPMSVGASAAAKAATSVLTKQLQSNAGVRLGSKDERRRVYARFQEAATEACAVISVTHVEQRLYGVFVGKHWFIPTQPGGRKATQAALASVQQVYSEIMKAYLDLRLVANPAPLAAADVVLDRFTAVLDLRIGVPHEELFTALSLVAEAQREFTDVCRGDLWYLVKRWQFFRPRWWTQKKWRRTK